MKSQSETTGPIAVKRSFKSGSVGVALKLSVRGWTTGSAKIEASTDLTTDQARALAGALIEAADKAQAKVNAKLAADTRRQKWRDQEIAAGRMVVIRARPCPINHRRPRGRSGFGGSTSAALGL